MQIMSSYDENLTNTLNIQKLVSVLVVNTSGSHSDKEEALSEGKLGGLSQMAESPSAHASPPPLLILKRPQSDQLRFRHLTFACLRLHTPSESQSFSTATRVALAGSDFVCLYIVYSHHLVTGNEEKGLANHLLLCFWRLWSTRAVPLSLNFSEQLCIKCVLLTGFKESSMKDFIA